MTQPQSTSITSGQSVTLSVTINSAASPTFQWYTGASGNTSSPVGSGSSAAVTVSPAKTTSYWVRVSNGCDPPADSAAAIVTVNGCPGITINSISSSTSIVKGKSVTLSVDATGSSGVAIQWYLGTPGDISRPQQSGATIVVQPVATTSYWARATNSCGATVDSAPVTITITPCDPPSIVIQPHGGNVVAASTAVVVAQAAGTAPLHYQWFAGHAGDTSTPVGSDSSTLSVDLLMQTTTYWLRVTNDCGSVDAAEATVVVDQTCSAPVIVVQPSDAAIGAGGTARLRVVAGGDNLTYRWYLGDLFDFTHLIGINSPELITPPITATQRFFLRIDGACGSATSVAVTVDPSVSRRRGVGH